MDRHRFSSRVRELKERAKLVEDLGRVPDRAKEKDFRDIAELLRKTAADIEELVDAKLPGCICRRIDHDDYSYLVYADECRHHHRLHVLTEKLKADYAKMEKTLKDEVRMKLIAAALSGTAGMPPIDRLVENAINDRLVENAITVADETIRRLTVTP